MGVMKMGNILPRAELEPTSLAFWASVLLQCAYYSVLITPYKLPDVTTIYPRPSVYAAPCLSGQCRLVQ